MDGFVHIWGEELFLVRVGAGGFAGGGDIRTATGTTASATTAFIGIPKIGIHPPSDKDGAGNEYNDNNNVL
jgi:ammonia channel protein AmtB